MSSHSLSHWWKDAFDLLYLETDARSVEDPRQTAREVDLYLEMGKWKPGDPILDLCGGHGRHTLELLTRGWGPMTLLDYSLPLLQEAQKRSESRNLSPFITRGDARHLPFKANSFQGVLLVGNSFGYFPHSRDNRAILQETHRVLKPGGSLVIETANKEFVGKGLPPFSRHKTPSGLVVERSRKLEPPLLICQERVSHPTKGILKEHTYCLHLYSREEMTQMLKEAGFTQTESRPFSLQPRLQQDRGTMESRIVLAGRKPPNPPALPQSLPGRPRPSG